MVLGGGKQLHSDVGAQISVQPYGRRRNDEPKHVLQQRAQLRGVADLRLLDGRVLAEAAPYHVRRVKDVVPVLPDDASHEK